MKSLNNWKTVALAAMTLTLGACGGGSDEPAPAAKSEGEAAPSAQAMSASMTAKDVDGAAISNANATPEVWITHGGNYEEQRHSRLTSINKDTIGDLELVWHADLYTNRGVEATPIVVDGIMYATSSWSFVYAFDAKTGETIWDFDPGVDRSRGVYACCDVVNRGVAVWKGKVYVGTIDGRLIALDAKTGDVVWEKITVDQSKPYTITGAPRVVKGKVLIGNGGAELGVRGYVTAYDAETGDQAWRFYTTPNPKKEADGAASDSAHADIANATWGPDGAWTHSGGGGTAWDAMAYDEELDLLYIGVGNGAPWNHEIRDPSGGDNLFLSSIVAVKPDTGEYVWHHQTTPGDNWDYTATQHIIIAELPLGDEGAMRKVVMQAPKNGYFYVLDAATGEFVSGAPFVPLNWSTGLDENGRPIENPDARKSSIEFFQLPAPYGAHNWHPMAYNPEEGLVYIPAMEIPFVYVQDGSFIYRDGVWNIGFDSLPGATPPVPAIMAEMKALLKGKLLAWDPVKQEARWTLDQPLAWNGGVLSTEAGIIFQGRMTGEFNAYDAGTGDKLWSFDAGAGVLSGPVTYEIDGEQYVTVTAGWGSVYPMVAGFTLPKEGDMSIGRVLTFKLNGGATLPPNDLEPFVPQKPVAKTSSGEAQHTAGKTTYYQFCMMCHGEAAIGGGVIPDLRWSRTLDDQESFNKVVLEGERSAFGMVGFGKWVSEEEAVDLRAYLLDRANDDYDYKHSGDGSAGE